ncbi:putative nuclease HARBI1 isoform X2 [Ruditapes philippinarum]|nr:putative nuclease HARBI1 isoform X2 [Ruditapes philippinarum]XP_060571377.1 putative nuclease HARBI1 isoform X2 [Ruditapes philippinarum]
MADFGDLTNEEVISRYGLDKDGILFLTELLREDLQPKTERKNTITLLQKVKIALRYFASGEIQLNDADIHGISQSSVSRVISQVIHALSRPHIVQTYIKFPKTQQELQDLERQFYGTASFPNVFGVIDGTHVQIQGPTQNKGVYVNRMNYHSINTQVVFDPNDRIIDIVARWPGSVPDSRILRESGVWALMEGGHLPPGDHYLLGDSGYPCERWLLTPYLNPQQGSQTQYNSAHKSTRAKVERGIGQLKGRWGVLHSEIKMNPEKVCKLIVCCGVLHNLCKSRNIPMPLDILHNDHNQPPTIVHSGPQDGLKYRDYVAETYF